MLPSPRPASVGLAAAAAIALAAALASPAAGDAPELSEERIAELERLVGGGGCADALPRIEELRKAHPEHPDLLVLEGNCRVRTSESTQRVFDRLRFERAKIALGAESVERDMADRFSVVQRTYDEEALEEGLALFRRALELAPERSDFIVGTAAVLSHTGRADAALDVIREHRSSLDDQDVSDVVQLAQDRINEARFEQAERLLDGLEAAFPEHEGPPTARASLALARFRGLEAIQHLAVAHQRSPSNRSIALELTRLRLLAGQLDRAVENLVPLTKKAEIFQVWLALARSVRTPASAAQLWTDLATRIDQLRTVDDSTKNLIRHYERLLGGKSGLPDAGMRLRGGQMLRAQGLRLPAVIEYRAAIAARPDLLEARVELARTLGELLLFDIAIGALDEALAVAEQLPEAERPYTPDELRGWRAEVLLALGEFERAREACRELRGGAEARPYVQALAAEGLGREREARRLLRRVAEAGGPHAASARARLEGSGAGEN